MTVFTFCRGNSLTPLADLSTLSPPSSPTVSTHHVGKYSYLPSPLQSGQWMLIGLSTLTGLEVHINQ